MKRRPGRHEWQDDSRESPASLAKPFRHGAKPIPQRKRVSDCDYGDLVELADGRRALVTGSITGSMYGRFLGPDGKEGPFERLPDLSCRRIRGYR